MQPTLRLYFELIFGLLLTIGSATWNPYADIRLSNLSCVYLVSTHCIWLSCPNLSLYLCMNKSITICNMNMMEHTWVSIRCYQTDACASAYSIGPYCISGYWIILTSSNGIVRIKHLRRIRNGQRFVWIPLTMPVFHRTWAFIYLEASILSSPVCEQANMYELSFHLKVKHGIRSKLKKY